METVKEIERNAEIKSGNQLKDQPKKEYDFLVTFPEERGQISKITGEKINYLGANSDHLFLLGKVVLLFAYFVYFGFALCHYIGDEGSWRLIGCTIVGALFLLWNLLMRTHLYLKWTSGLQAFYTEFSKGNRTLVVKWFFPVARITFLVVYLVTYVAMKTPENLWSLFGLFGFPFLMFLYSNNKCKVKWQTMCRAMYIQFIMALLIMKTSLGADIVRRVSRRLEALLAPAASRCIFIFGKNCPDLPFAILAKIVVIVIAMMVLVHFGVIDLIKQTVGRVSAFFHGASPLEEINASEEIDADEIIFLHVAESEIFIQDYQPEMTSSEVFMLLTLMTVESMASVIFMASGIPAASLIAASAMSAPATLAASKLFFHSHDREEASARTSEDIKMNTVYLFRHPSSLMDPIILGTHHIIMIVGHLFSFVLSLVIFLTLMNSICVWFGERIGVENMTLEFLLSYAFYPFAYMMGAKSNDCLFIGELLGVRTTTFPILAYLKLDPIIKNGIIYREYIAGGVNNTWTTVGNNIFLDKLNKTLVGGVIDHRSEIIATYALCGSASFGTIGAILAYNGGALPHRIGEATRHIFRAMIVGILASFLTACFAGLLHEDDFGTY